MAKLPAKKTVLDAYQRIMRDSQSFRINCIPCWICPVNSAL